MNTVARRVLEAVRDSDWSALREHERMRERLTQDGLLRRESNHRTYLTDRGKSALAREALLDALDVADVSDREYVADQIIGHMLHLSYKIVYE